MEHSPEPWHFKSHATSPSDAWVHVMAANRKTIIYDACNECELPPIVADLRRIVACVNACAGIPTEELEREEPYVTTVALTTLGLLREFYERGGLNSVPTGCTVTPQIAISPMHYERFMGQMLNPESWNHSDTAIRVCRNAGYKVTNPDGTEIQ